MPQQPIRLPPTFEENRGQAPANVKWLGRSSKYFVSFEEDGVTFLLPDKNDLEASLPHDKKPPAHRTPIRYNVIHMKLSGSKPWKNISGLEPTGGVSNYLNPQSSKNNISGVPQFERIKVAGVYDGIDLVFYCNGDDLEYDFVVDPGVDPSQIEMTFIGTQSVDVDAKSGELVLTSQDGSHLRQHRPDVYQQVDGKRVAVEAGYRTPGPGRAAFTLAHYDRTRSITIDPSVDFTTFYGGSFYDEAYAIAVDANGYTYMTGGTGSTDFPVTNGSKFLKNKNFQFLGFTSQGPNIFVAELNPAGKLIFASYGGDGNGNAIAVDNSGAYVTGYTIPPDEDNVIGYTDNDDGDPFVWRVQSQSGFQDYFRVFGAVGTDYGTAIGVDSAHNAWVTGPTYIGKEYNNPKSGDMFVVEFTPEGLVKKDLTFASNGQDLPMAMAIGPATQDRAWITGKTCGNGFPTTDGLLHELSHCAVFLLVLENSGTQDVGMVFGGSDGDDAGTGITPNGPNSAYIAGTVNSTDFPTTQGAFQTTKSPGPQAFVTQVDAMVGPGQIVHSTLFSADGTTVASSIANADGKGVYLAGNTTSVHLPGGPQLAPNPTAGFFTKFSVDLSAVRYTQLLGLAISGLVVENTPSTAPVIYTTGFRYSGIHDGFHEDAFAVKLEENTPTSSVTTLPPEEDDTSFSINWTGTDPSSTIASYDVYVSDNGGSFTAFQTDTAATMAVFTGTKGHTYGFYSVATDSAGNREPMKTAPDTVVRIGPPPPVTITCTNCSFQNGNSKATFALNVTTGMSTGTFTFNNGDTSNPIQFAATDITKTSVNGDFATISGDGKLNGTPGYTFTVSATDAGGPGSGMDSVLIQLFGPNNFSFNAPANVTGGDVVVK
jgi:hypothetical protein